MVHHSPATTRAVQVRLTKYLALFTIFTLTACDPGPDRLDGTNPALPVMKTGFHVYPESKWINVGDTFYLSASIGTTLSNGVELADGTVNVDARINKFNDTVADLTKSIASTPALRGQDYDVTAVNGALRFDAKAYPNICYGYVAAYEPDSFRMAYRFVFKTKGVYIFDVRPGYAYTSKGKTSTYPSFAVADCHWSFFKPSIDTPLISNPDYFISYFIGVR